MGGCCCGSRSWETLPEECTGGQRAALLRWLRGGGGPPGPPCDFEDLGKLDLREHFVYVIGVRGSDLEEESEQEEEEVFDTKAFGAFVREVLPRLMNITELSLRGNALCGRQPNVKLDQLALALKAGALPRCKTLDLSSNGLGLGSTAETTSVLEAVLPRSLVCLNLSDNPLFLLTSEGWRTIANLEPQLQRLKLANAQLNRMDENSWEVLGSTLECFPALMELDLSGNALLGSEEMIAKSVLPRLPHLEVLGFGRNNIGLNLRNGMPGTSNSETHRRCELPAIHIAVLQAAAPSRCRLRF